MLPDVREPKQYVDVAGRPIRLNGAEPGENTWLVMPSTSCTGYRLSRGFPAEEQGIGDAIVIASAPGVPHLRRVRLMRARGAAT